MIRIKDVYIENYESYSEEDIKKIFATWFSNEYIKTAGTFDAKGERLVEEQWEGSEIFID